MQNSLDQEEAIHIRCSIPQKRWIESEAAKHRRSLNAQVNVILHEQMKRAQHEKAGARR